jgi:O-antigen/teichoic acid export membrane protein
MLLASAIITPVLLELLGSGKFGQYGSVMAVFGLLMILVSSGVNGGVRKYISEERDDEHWRDYVFAYYFRLATALALVAAALVALGAYFGVFSELLNADYETYSTYFYLLALLVVAAQFREYVRRALMGLKLETIAEPLRAVTKVAFGVSAIALVVLGYGVVGVILGFIIASLLVFVIGTVVISRHVSLRYVFKPLPRDFPREELFSFNHLTVVYVFFLTSMYHVDVLLLDALVGHEAAGLYKAALVLVQFLWVVPMAIQSILLQSTSNLWAEGRTAQIEEIGTKATRYGLLLTALLAVGLGALSFDFVPMYYGGRTRIVLPVLLLLPGTLGFAVARPLLSINHAKGDMKTLIAITGTAAGLNLVLNLLLIPRFGMVGAAVATTIGYSSLPVLQIWGARRLGYDPLADARLGRIALTTGLAAIPIVGLAMLIQNGLLALVVVPPVGLVVYGVLSIATGALDVDEVLAILAGLPEPVPSTVNAVWGRVGAGNVGGD